MTQQNRPQQTPPGGPQTPSGMRPRAEAEKYIHQLLLRGQGQLASALPHTLGMSPKTLIRAVLTEIRMSDKLWECDPISIVKSALECAALGLLPNRVTGHVYLVPFKDNNPKSPTCGKMICTTIPGYRGLADIARRSGNISTLTAHVVHEKDEFDFALGDKPFVLHKPAFREVDPGHTIAAYAVARLRDGGLQIAVMSVPEIEYIRSQSKQPDGKLWTDHYDEACCKTVLRRLWKQLPISVEALNLLERERIKDEGTDEERAALGEPAEFDLVDDAPSREKPAAPSPAEAEARTAAISAFNDSLEAYEAAGGKEFIESDCGSLTTEQIIALRASVVSKTQALAKKGGVR